MQALILLDLSTNIKDLDLKTGSTTDFNQNINNGTGVNIGSIQRHNDTTVNFAKGVNHDTVDKEILKDNNADVHNKSVQ